MPAATSHNIFANDLYLKYKNQIEFKELFFLGCQGPDIFFHDFVGITKNSYLKYGELLHHSKVRDSITFMYNYTKGTILEDYFKGYLAHYCLDLRVHPLVNYYADFLKNNSHLEAHFKVEAAIDVFTLESHGKSIKDFDCYLDIKVEKEKTDLIGEMYHQLFLSVFDLDLKASQISRACRLMPFFMYLLKPNTKIKYDLIYQVEKIAKSHFVSSLMLYQDLPFDISNPKNLNIINPKNKKMQFNYSLAELFDIASRDFDSFLFKFDKNKINYDFEGVNLVF